MELLDKIAPAIVAAQAELGPIHKSATNKFDNYKYATLGDYVTALSPVLAKHGLCVLTSVTGSTPCDRTTTKGNKENGVFVNLTLTIMHVSGQYLILTGVGEGQDRADKATYKAITGGRKYLLASAFGLATTDDPERDETVGAPSSKTATPRSRKATAPALTSAPGGRSNDAAPFTLPPITQSLTPAEWGVFISQLADDALVPFFTVITQKDDVLSQEGVRYAVCNAVAKRACSIFAANTPERAAIRTLMDEQKKHLGTSTA